MLGRTKLTKNLLLLGGIMWFLSGTAQGQGFSGRFNIGKMDVQLRRKSPPPFYIINPLIRIQVKSLVAKASAYEQTLVSMLESNLIERDRRFKPEDRSPETVIVCAITRLDTDEKWESRKTTERRKTGERQKYDDKDKKYKTEPVFTDVEVTKRYKVVTGYVNISYQIKDVKSGSILDSANLPSAYNEYFLEGNGAPALASVEQDLVRSIVAVVSARLTPSIELVTVLLAQGKLKDTAKLGEAGLWQRMVEAFEIMQPLKTPKDDAYRLYNIAVGYEALAYQAEDALTTKRFLEKASALYSQALEMNPGEKYFREPQNRIVQAITQYRKLEDQIGEYERAKSRKEQIAPPATSPAPSAPNSKNLPAAPNSSTSPSQKTMTNAEVINLVNKGLDEANLILAIKQAPTVQFALSPEAIGKLLDNKVSNAIIRAMRTRQSQPAPPRPGRKKKG